MFQSARLKLTLWYLLIIMLVSVSFSMVTYRALTSELDRIERVQHLRVEREFIDPEGIHPRPPFLDPALIVETKNRIKLILILINSGILIFSTTGGYFLAGRTLKPIAEMVDEQNRFVTDASHELRTPLTSLKSEIEVNLRDKKMTLLGAKKLLQSNLEDVNNLQALSDGLIKSTQYRRGSNNLAFTELSLREVIEEAIKKVAYLAKNKNIEISRNVDYDKIFGNKSALIEVFVIFLDNAIKYSRPQTKVNIGVKRTDGIVSIQIKDNGVGISPEDLPHIFDRFYRADKSRTKTEASGYGLGLSIAEEIVTKHRGTIEVQSQINKGTIFTVKLPI